MSEDRSVILTRITNDFMGNGGWLPLPGDEGWPEGCIGLWAEHLPLDNEIRFVARYEDEDVEAWCSLHGYSLEGGLHRDH